MVYSSKEHIKQLLKQKRSLEAEYDVLFQSRLRERTFSQTQADRLEEIERRMWYIKNWLISLPEDEAFVIQRHLVDGIDFSRIAIEYSAKWGKENARSIRTLMGYQKRALERIAAVFDSLPLDSFK